MTGSVSRGVADDVSDVEMLLVTRRAARPRDVLRACRGGRARAARLVGAAGAETLARLRVLRGDPVRADLVVARVRRRGDQRGVAGRGRDRERRLAADVRPARRLAGAAQHLPGRARGGADRGRGADVGRVRRGRPSDDRAARRAARARRADGRRRGTRPADGLRDQPRPGSRRPSGSRCAPRHSRSSRTGSPSGSRRRSREPDPLARAHRHDTAPAGHGRARAERAEHRSGARLARRGARRSCGARCPTRSSRRSRRRSRRARRPPATSTRRRSRSARRASAAITRTSASSVGNTSVRCVVKSERDEDQDRRQCERDLQRRVDDHGDREVGPVARCELNTDHVLDRVSGDRDDHEPRELLAHVQRVDRRRQRTDEPVRRERGRGTRPGEDDAGERAVLQRAGACSSAPARRNGGSVSTNTASSTPAQTSESA